MISPAEKLSVTEMLKKRMREEEMAKEKPKRRRRSSVFGEHEESRPFERECASYELLPDAPESVDQLAYWLAHKEQFPILSHLAKVIFAVRAASSKSERVFSAAGNTITPKRARLNPEKVEECVIVRCNLRTLKSMGLRS